MTLNPIIKKLGTPKYKQIISAVEEAIVDEKLKKGDKLPSISSIQKDNKVSRDTVLNALSELKTRGIIQSIAGKGYYVLSEDVGTEKKVFLLFDELNAFKEDLYNTFLKNLDVNTEVDIYFHHFNPSVFSKLIYENIGNYSSYVIMTANLENTLGVVEKLPKEKVYILDQMHEEFTSYAAIYQNFERDIYTNLTEGLSLIQKYAKLVLLFSERTQPLGMKKGFELFCQENHLDFEVLDSVEDRELTKGEIYVIPDDRNLIRVVKKIKEQGFVLSEDLGIISYNDTLLKEIVEGGITTISTDFKEMGKRLAQMINENEHVQIENTNHLILRKSL
ncbi:GntR family transcriptional regulator [Wenyingzhuangia sp. 2_MG-2023]|uniref:GntR family transcriptional regulator n=1 Tax=Wenyingzhuangia sp. 2_MG-2023 TaxID=3062639 RepID=UPI0026E1BDAD|nr:GntR family transcriptional regulator [Wenyingzhuangia sp. 2_MG-2023]MDO6736478.1 GntR family transcriptional regulator [Wenyingzhuangia sp. 2_MG-2023]MDO6801215.1 GntR family transcriptional regulator [Wenyingzhuangia sp. 1_MG-2023]